MNQLENRVELSNFLRSRRERLTPSQVGLKPTSRRRTPGLRREEVAHLAGIGVTWYTMLEQGRDIKVSTQILESLTRVFQLNSDERNHLYLLARDELPVVEAKQTLTLDPVFQQLLTTFGTAPAYIVNERRDVLGWNSAACQVFTDWQVLPLEQRNIVKFVFNDPLARELFVEWEAEAKRTLAFFRASSSRYIAKPWMSDFITEMMETSAEFRRWWPQHDVQASHVAVKELKHQRVGILSLQPLLLHLSNATDLSLVVYLPNPQTDTASKLEQLLD